MIDWNTGSANNTNVGLLTPDSTNSTSEFERAVTTRPRPCLLINERELSVLRRGLTKDGWKRGLYLQPVGHCNATHTGAGLLSLANKWLDAKVEPPDWRSTEVVTCCTDGRQLMTSLDCTKWEDSVHTLDDCVVSVPVWHARCHAMAAGALALAIVYGLERDKAYAEKAAEVMLTLAEAYSNSSRPQSARCDARFIVPITQAYDLLYHSRCLSDEDKELIENQLLSVVAAELAAQDNDGSDGAWGLSAIGMIGLAVKDPALVRKSLSGLTLWLERLAPDGLVGGSLGDTHFDALAALIHLAEACYRCGIDIYNMEPAPGKSIRGMFSSPIRYTYPSFRLPAIGDSSYTAFLPLDIYEVAYRRWPEPELSWVLKRGYGFAGSPVNADQSRHIGRFSRGVFYAFLFGRDLPGRSVAISPKSRVLSSQGVCCLRNSASVMATVVCGPHNSDSHLDRLSFTLYANNELLAPDYGAPAEESETNAWFKETWAHNTVVVDGQSQSPSQDWARVDHCLGTDFQGAQFVDCDSYPGVRHQRTIILLGDICILTDSITSADKHTYDWLMRCEGQPTLLGTHPSLDAKHALHPMITPKSSYQVEGAVTVDWACENGGMNQTIWSGPGPAEITLATCPAETMHRRVPLVVCRQHGRQAEFISAFVPTRPQQACDVSKNGRLLVVSSDYQTDYIHCRMLSDHDSQTIVTDAQFAALRIRRGVVQSIIIAHGSRLEWEGQVMVECPSDVHCLEATFDGHGPQVRCIGGTAGMLALRTSARTARLNGYRAATLSSGGVAKLRVTPQMIITPPSDNY